MILFHSCLVHASTSNLSPWNRVSVYLSLCAVSNHIRRFKRPEYIAHRDFTPIECLPDDCLLKDYDVAAAVEGRHAHISPPVGAGGLTSGRGAEWRDGPAEAGRQRVNALERPRAEEFGRRPPRAPGRAAGTPRCRAWESSPPPK